MFLQKVVLLQYLKNIVLSQHKKNGIKKHITESMISGKRRRTG